MCGRLTITTILRGGAFDRGAETSWHVSDDLVQRLRRGRHMIASQLVQRVTRKRTPPADHFVEHETEAVDIGAAVDLGIAVARDLAPLFRRHVIRSAKHLS